MKTRKMSKSGWMLCMTLMIAVPAIVLMAAEHGKKMPGMGDPMMDMHKQCMKLCEKGCGDTDAMVTWLDEAVEALDAGDTEQAKTKIAAVKAKLAAMKADMKECMQKTACCNMKCPGCGMKIDMKDTPEDQMRICHDMKVGFCSSACAAKWDTMTDEEKMEKLKKCMPQKEEMMKQGMEKMHKHKSEHPR